MNETDIMLSMLNVLVRLELVIPLHDNCIGMHSFGRRSVVRKSYNVARYCILQGKRVRHDEVVIFQ
jgi:hypothetical protein